jgi:hypothetical protein
MQLRRHVLTVDHPNFVFSLGVLEQWEAEEAGRGGGRGISRSRGSGKSGGGRRCNLESLAARPSERQFNDIKGIRVSACLKF